MPFECQFDRGGVDPGPLIQSIETGAKKKAAKPTSVPSPGSSNSQDSFPPPGSGGASLDGYGGYPGQYPPTTPGQQPDYNASPMQRPPSQSNAQSPHPGKKFCDVILFDSKNSLEKYTLSLVSFCINFFFLLFSKIILSLAAAFKLYIFIYFKIIYLM